MLYYFYSMKLIFSMLLIIATAGSIAAQKITPYSADNIIRRTSSKDTVYIINFWATWCSPCVAELPEFNALYRKYANAPVKVLMVCLDFKEDIKFKVPSFIERKKLLPEVVWLSDTDPNVFIPKLENSWEGSIPATIVVAPGKNYKKFMEGSVTAQQIGRITDNLLEEE